MLCYLFHLGIISKNFPTNQDDADVWFTTTQRQISLHVTKNCNWTQQSSSLSFFSAWYFALRFLKKSGEQTSRCLYSSSGSGNRSCFIPCRRKPLQRTATRDGDNGPKNWLCIWLLFLHKCTGRYLHFYVTHKYPRKAWIRIRIGPMRI